MPPWHASTCPFCAQHIVHMSLGHAHPLQNWSHIWPSVVLMPVVIVVVALVLAVVDAVVLVLVLDSSAPPELLLEPELLASPPLLDASLAVLSLSPVALLLALVVIVVPTVNDVPNVGSSRVSLPHAMTSTPTRMHRAIVSTVAHLVRSRRPAIAAQHLILLMSGSKSGRSDAIAGNLLPAISTSQLPAFR
jgi:hypothetical protein